MAARLSGNRLARGAKVLFAMSPFANMYFCMCCRSCARTSCSCWVHQFASFCSSDFAGPRWQVELEISPLWLLHPLQGNGLFILERSTPSTWSRMMKQKPSELPSGTVAQGPGRSLRWTGRGWGMLRTNSITSTGTLLPCWSCLGSCSSS